MERGEKLVVAHIVDNDDWSGSRESSNAARTTARAQVGCYSVPRHQLHPKFGDLGSHQMLRTDFAPLYASAAFNEAD